MRDGEQDPSGQTVTGAAAEAALGRLIAETRALLSPLAGSLGGTLAHWPAARHLHRSAPAALPVLRWLPQALDGCGCAPFAAALREAAPLLRWRQTYTAAEVPAGFLERYGWTALVGPDGVLASDALACGVLLLGPATLYPSHAHAAEEFYLPLAGTADWQQGDQSFRPRGPGTVIRHASEEPHAMRTGAEPLLALYLWQGDGIGACARLGPPAAS